MNTKLNVAVAAALLAAASSAQAGIVIPAGDWTLDIGGIVNAYYTTTSYSGDNAAGTGPLGLGRGDQNTTNNITTGLLPNYLSVSGKTRQNDLDVGFTISINPGASTTQALVQNTNGNNQENRQAFITIGDASWGSVKLGKDIGIFASDAILNDMTLLGVGAGAGNLAGNTTTLGRIGTGFIYADWKAQVAYTSPNFSGFQFTAGVTQAFNAIGDGATSAFSTRRGGSTPAFEGKASYEFTGDVAGKVWVSAISQKVDGLAINGATPTSDPVSVGNDRATAFDIGTTINVAGFGLTGYYYDGRGIGQTGQLVGGFDSTGKRRDSNGYYVQGTYVIPGVGTKLGASWGESKLDGNNVDRTIENGFDEIKDSMWVVGAYHPLTKHLNIVAEYSVSEREVDQVNAATLSAKAKTVSLGAILFF